MAKHNVVIHENTGATRVSAPYLGTYETKDTAVDATIYQAAAEKAGLGFVETKAIIDGSLAVFEALEQESACRINTDLGAIVPVITGSVNAASSALTSDNSVDLVLRVCDDIRLALVNQVPYIASESGSVKLRVDKVMDQATPRPYSLIHGSLPFDVYGQNMVLNNRTQVYFEADDSTTYALNYEAAEVAGTQHLICNFEADNMPSEGCDGKVVVKSDAGESEGPVQTSYTKVKFLYVAPVEPPTLTDLYSEGYESEHKVGNTTTKITVLGTNLADVVKSEIKFYAGDEDVTATLDVEGIDWTIAANRIDVDGHGQVTIGPLGTVGDTFKVVITHGGTTVEKSCVLA